MPGDVNLAFVAALVAAVLGPVGIGLPLVLVQLQAERRRRRRLGRVSRRRAPGRLDMDDARLSLARGEQESTALAALAQSLARVVPLLDRTRLRANLFRAGLSMSTGTFVLLSLCAAAALAAAGRSLLGAPLALLAPPSLIGGMFLMDALVTLRGDMIAERFMKQLPDAIDTIIRGIRSGLPVIECIGIAGQESPEPIGPHFRAISERVQLGEPLETALWRVARIVNKPEMDFLAVAVSIQMETGGSLAEALGNLADLLRKREHMKMKIRAVSSEAKASALIIGALPFVMLGALSVMSPDYVAPLFTDPRGQTMLAAGLASILTGAFVMWRMTRFEI